MPARKDKGEDEDMEQPEAKILDAKTFEEIRRRPDFVDPSVVRIELADGGWIDVKEELTFGEQESLNSAGLRSMRTEAGAATEVMLDWDQFNMKKIDMWVIDWSFRDKNGRRLDKSEQTIRNLADWRAKEVLAAIEAHQAAMDEKRGQTNTAQIG